ncbi:MAG: peptidoglycan-binding protein, partial [Microvirga sp.]
MKLFGYVVLSAVGLTSIAVASETLTLDAVNSAGLSEKLEKGTSPVLIKAQVLLDRARFSPGVIDGRNGENLQNAIKAFEKVKGLKVDGKLDDEFWTKLNEGTSDPALVEYEISEGDVKGPFASIPDKMEDQAKLERLSYSSAEELLAEKFHMDVDLLKELNPGKRFDAAGTSIVVANVMHDPKNDEQAKKDLAKIEVVKSEKVLRALAKDGKIIAVYPASIGSDEKPAPMGSQDVRSVAPNPTYTYNPDYAFKGVKAKEKFVIKPGPNNPVGS